MRKVLLLILVCIILIACGLTAYDIHSQNSIGVVKDFAVSEDLAIEIGKVVLKDILGEEECEGKSFDIEERQRSYVVIMWNKDTVGYGYSVSINKRDGKILKIQQGE